MSVVVFSSWWVGRADGFEMTDSRVGAVRGRLGPPAGRPRSNARLADPRSVAGGVGEGCGRETVQSNAYVGWHDSQRGRRRPSNRVLADGLPGSRDLHRWLGVSSPEGNQSLVPRRRPAGDPCHVARERGTGSTISSASDDRLVALVHLQRRHMVRGHPLFQHLHRGRHIHRRHIRLHRLSRDRLASLW